MCVCALSSKAEVQSDRTLYVYVQSVPSTIGTIRFASPAVKTASFRDNVIIKMDDYLYAGPFCWILMCRESMLRK